MKSGRRRRQPRPARPRLRPVAHAWIADPADLTGRACLCGLRENHPAHLKPPRRDGEPAAPSYFEPVHEPPLMRLDEEGHLIPVDG